MDITERIHNAIEWANKRLTLQGKELSQEQKNYLTFALSQNFTDNAQALQLLQPDVIKSVCDCTKDTFCCRCHKSKGWVIENGKFVKQTVL
jgi:hypothetical protein